MHQSCYLLHETKSLKVWGKQHTFDQVFLDEWSFETNDSNFLKHFQNIQSSSSSIVMSSIEVVWISLLEKIGLTRREIQIF